MRDAGRFPLLARNTIEDYFKHPGLPSSPPAGIPEDWQEPGACFVTLTLDGRLRGCMGSLEPVRPLVEDVMQNAINAAFEDTRFPPLRQEELPGVCIEVSILSPREPFQVQNEAELLETLRPGIDGLVLSDPGRRATFLPSVWDQVGSAREFVQLLKQKAGLPSDYWSDTLRFERYTALNVSEES